MLNSFDDMPSDEISAEAFSRVVDVGPGRSGDHQIAGGLEQRAAVVAAKEGRRVEAAKAGEVRGLGAGSAVSLPNVMPRMRWPRVPGCPAGSDARPKPRAPNCALLITRSMHEPMHSQIYAHINSY